MSAFLSNPVIPADLLSVRERQALQLIAKGNSMKEVGKVLGTTARTAESRNTPRQNHAKELKHLQRCSPRVRYALKHGFVVEREMGRMAIMVPEPTSED